MRLYNALHVVAHLVLIFNKSRVLINAGRFKRSFVVARATFKSLMNFLSSIFKGILTYNVDHDLLFAAKTIGDLKVFCKATVVQMF